MTVWAEGEHLGFEGPEAVTTEAVVAALVEAKPALLAILEAEALAEYGLARCRECQRVLLLYHLEQYRCLDRVDCREAAAIVRWRGG